MIYPESEAIVTSSNAGRAIGISLPRIRGIQKWALLTILEFTLCLLSLTRKVTPLFPSSGGVYKKECHSRTVVYNKDTETYDLGNILSIHFSGPWSRVPDELIAFWQEAMTSCAISEYIEPKVSLIQPDTTQIKQVKNEPEDHLKQSQWRCWRWHWSSESALGYKFDLYFNRHFS